MTGEEAIAYFKRHIDLYCVDGISREAEEMAIKALEQQPCDDCVDRKAVDELCFRYLRANTDDNIEFYEHFRDLPLVTPTHGICKDCKHWKDSDGVYRRGIGAESKCPINNSRVLEGTFCCADFEKRGNENETN
jgi:hypothetical protein